MLLIHLDKNEHTRYLYQQIYEKIKQLIIEHKLEENEKLPSKRDLATQLQVSVNTITYAYEQLLTEGYIYTIERKGYFVEKVTLFSKRTQIKAIFPEELREVPLDKTGWLSLSHIATDASLFPYKDWKKYEQQAMDHHQLEFAHITHQQGPYAVRQSIAKLVRLTRGVVCEPEQIVIGVGTQSLLEQIMQLQGNMRKQKIAVEDPGYARIYRLLKQIGANVKAVPVDNQGMDIVKVAETDANMILVTPSHQFPMGTIMPISRRIQLLNWAVQQPNRYIMEDDYDSEFKYRTNHIPSLQSLDHHQRVIYFGTFSKSLLTGLRISYMVLPIPLLRKYQAHFSHLLPYNNTLHLYTLHYFIESGAYIRHIKRVNIHYEKKRKKIIETLYSYFNKEIEIEDIPAGLHFVVTIKTNKTYEEIEKIANKKKLEIYTMRRFMLENQIHIAGKIALVIGFAAISEEHIEKAVKRLYEVFHNS